MSSYSTFSSSLFILSVRSSPSSTSFTLFSRSSLQYLAHTSLPYSTPCFLYNSLLFYSSPSHHLLYFVLPSFSSFSLFSFPSSFSNIFVNFQFIYLSFNATISIYILPDNLINQIDQTDQSSSIIHYKSFSHSVPITSIFSDNIGIYILDVRNRLTEYKLSGTPASTLTSKPVVYDFVSPILFICDKFNIIADQLDIYAKNNKIYNLIKRFNINEINELIKEHGYKSSIDECNITGIILSDMGGVFILQFNMPFIFVYDNSINRTSLIKNTNKLNRVIAVDGRIIAVKNRDIRILGYYEDKEMDTKFRELKIEEKRRGIEEYDRKRVSAYIDEGMHKSRTNKIRKQDQQIRRNDQQISTTDQMHKSRTNKIGILDQQINLADHTTSIDKQISLTDKHTSTDSTRLLCYNIYGFISTSYINNYTLIKIFNKTKIEIKHSSTAGCIWNDEFILIYNNTINYNNMWCINMPNIIYAAINKISIFIVSDNLLVINKEGSIVSEMYVGTVTGMAASDEFIGMIVDGSILEYKIKDGKIEQGRIVGIGIKRDEKKLKLVYGNNKLYIQINSIIYKIEEMRIKRIAKIQGEIQAIEGERVIEANEKQADIYKPNVQHTEYEQEIRKIN